MPAEAVPEVQQGLVELWLYKFWVFEGPATLGAQELQACSGPLLAAPEVREHGSRRSEMSAGARDSQPE